MKRGDDLIEIRKNFHPPKYAKKDEIYIENEKNDYLIYSEDKNGCSSKCYFYNDKKNCSIEIRKKCRTKDLCFKKIEIHDILFDGELVKNTFDYLRYSSLKTEINELDIGEHFILED